MMVGVVYPGTEPVPDSDRAREPGREREMEEKKGKRKGWVTVPAGFASSPKVSPPKVQTTSRRLDKLLRD